MKSALFKKRGKFMSFLKSLWHKPVYRWLIISLVLYVFLIQHILLVIFGQFGLIYPTFFWDDIISICELITLCTGE